MVYNECNLRAGVYKVQTFGTTQYKTLIKRVKSRRISIDTK